jgi:cytochrome c-type biogenesis protein CcmH/NrfG
MVVDIANPIRKALLSLAVVVAIAGLPGIAAADSSGFFGGIFGGSSHPAPPANEAVQNPDDPILLKNQKKPGVELYVAVAHLNTETGKFPEAEDQYRQAAKIAPDDIRVLLGYAMLKDQMNQPDESLKLYQQAAKKHPNEPAVYNNLAVHFIRYNRVPEAIEASKKAVELRPHEPRYRNNLAALLVEAGLTQEAFKQLRAVYDEPVAHYDLGFLLNKRGLKPAALQEFSTALQMSPGMNLARQWVERLSKERAEHEATAMSNMPQRPAAMAVGPAPSYQRDYAPAPSAPSAPLPPQYNAPPQYRTPASAPGQVQYPPSQPQYQAPVVLAPMTAARDTGVRVLPPPNDGNNLRRLPPVNVPDSDQEAPNPPDMRR